MTLILRNLLVGCAMLLPAAVSFAMPPMESAPMEMPPPYMLQGNRGEPTGEPMSEHAPPWLHGIDLSEEVRDKIFDVFHAQAPAMRAREKELRQSMDALRTLALTGDFDDTKAKVLSNTSGRALAEIALMRARTDQQIYRLLTPAQRQEVAQREPGLRKSHQSAEPRR